LGLIGNVHSYSGYIGAIHDYLGAFFRDIHGNAGLSSVLISAMVFYDPLKESKSKSSESPSSSESSESSLVEWMARAVGLLDESSEVVLLAPVAMSFPVVTDADAESRALLTVVVELSGIRGRIACANPGQVHPALVTARFLADDGGILKAILVVRPSVVRLIEHVTEFDIL